MAVAHAAVYRCSAVLRLMCNRLKEFHLKFEFNCRDFYPHLGNMTMVLPTVWGLIAGNCRQNVKVHAVPRGVAVVKDD